MTNSFLKKLTKAKTFSREGPINYVQPNYVLCKQNR